MRLVAGGVGLMGLIGFDAEATTPTGRRGRLGGGHPI